MIEESYVRFETAKMLKEAGFKARCGAIVEDDGRKLYRPTQALAARWLREVHGIHVFTNYFFEDNDWFYVITDTNQSDEVKGIRADIRSYCTSEEAFEAGLQEAIKLIKKYGL